jgi:hypothetical protein
MNNNKKATAQNATKQGTFALLTFLHADFILLVPLLPHHRYLRLLSLGIPLAYLLSSLSTPSLPPWHWIAHSRKDFMRAKQVEYLE